MFMGLTESLASVLKEKPPAKPAQFKQWAKRMEEFERFALHARDTAGKLIAYQSPTYRSVVVDDRRSSRNVVQRYETNEEALAALHERGILIDNIYEPLGLPAPDGVKQNARKG